MSPAVFEGGSLSRDKKGYSLERSSVGSESLDSRFFPLLVDSLKRLLAGEGELFFLALLVLRAGESAGAGDFLALRVGEPTAGIGDRGDFLALRVLRAGESAAAGDFMGDFLALRVFRAGESITTDRAAGSGEEGVSFITPGGSME